MMSDFISIKVMKEGKGEQLSLPNDTLSVVFESREEQEKLQAHVE